MNIFSKFFTALRKPLPDSEVLEALGLFSARLDDYDLTLKAHRQALWRIEKRVEKYLGKDNGDASEPVPAAEREPACGEATKSVW